MPYVNKESREKYINISFAIANKQIETKGDLEYLVFVLMKQYMSTREQRYSTLHDCAYAVQHASDEFRRRYLDKREDQALSENGDI
jgi:hypothetical protein